jgi:hypothetical protein
MKQALTSDAVKASGALLLVGLVLTACAACGRVENSTMPGQGTVAASRPAPADSPSEGDDGTADPDADPTDDPLPEQPTGEPAPDTGATAVACAGKPSTAQVVSALRRDRSDIPLGGTAPTASTGPLCAGSWQYTVLSLPNREPLQVITRGPVAALKVVTAGTYVCTPTVTATAPAGIAAAAHCQ